MHRNYVVWSDSLLYTARTVFTLYHYENMPIQIYKIFRLKKMIFYLISLRKHAYSNIQNFQIKKKWYLHISAQNIDGGYSL